MLLVKRKIYDLKWRELKLALSSNIGFVFSVVSIIVTILFTAVGFYKAIDESVNYVIYALIAILFFKTIIILVVLAKNSKLNNINADNQYLISENDKLVRLSKVQSETFHNITHYHRNLMCWISEFEREIVVDDNKFNSDGVKKVLDRNHDFLILLTTALQNYFSISSDDGCAVTLKLLNQDGGLVKTLFRDPTNLKKRRDAEILYTDGEYDPFENTALAAILNDKITNSYFASDNLKELYSAHKYENINKRWFKLYNATVVVSISRILAPHKRHVVGFLAVDNFGGNLAHENVLEFLFGISDLLYQYFIKMNAIVDYCEKNSYTDEKIRRYQFKKTGESS